MLSIIIVNYKTSGDIRKCLQSIEKYEKNYKEYEIIVVDNNSEDDGLEKLEKEYKDVKFIHAPKNGGFAYGNNIGIEASKGEYILLLNPDTYIEDNAIEKLLTCLKNNNHIGIIGPKLLSAEGGNESYYSPKAYMTPWRLFCERFYLYRVFKKVKFLNSYFRTYMDYDRATYVESVSGAVFMFPRKLIDMIGLLDDKYFMYFEENDYCLQAIRKGYKLYYYPESKVVHIGGVTNAKNAKRKMNMFISSFKYYFRKNFSILTYLTALSIYLSGSILRMFLLMIKLDSKYKIEYYSIKEIFTSKIKK